jgi:hypothetical protein
MAGADVTFEDVELKTGREQQPQLVPAIFCAVVPAKAGTQ